MQYLPQRQSLPASYYDCWQALHRPTRGTNHWFDPATKPWLTPGQQSESEERHFLELLAHKSPAWAYEREVRMIYDVAKLVASPHYRKIEFPCAACSRKERAAKDGTHASDRDAIYIKPEAVRAVIFGADCPLQMVRSVFEVVSAQTHGHVEAYWSPFCA